ncbi:hypothetical protein NQ317_018803 [Molorchus minor]|uniref:Uncharacterized protein n=1 Tax=Molorchus minor TaxID=1323400 RepID=A0ABQ9ITH8_9CUCU|nr:hypothetical protein NQ317_018803 [Molorchus minor]
MLQSIDSDFEEQTKHARTYSQDIALSLCGWEPEPSCDRFLEHLVKFSDLCNNPILFENPNLVVRIKDKYYMWKIAAPIITSILVYGRPLVQSSVEQLCSMHMPPSQATDSPSEEQKQPQEARYSWWNWRRSRASRETTPALENALETNKTAETKDIIIKDIVEEEVVKKGVVGEGLLIKSDASLSPLSSSSDKCRKTLRLSSKQITLLNLRDGVNGRPIKGTTRCQCHLYKWRWDDKIVISDIDGTITKSDVLGHILPIVVKTGLNQEWLNYLIRSQIMATNCYI